MSNFDEAVVHEAVNSVQPFLQALDEAQHECQEAIRYVQALGERLKADRQELREAVSVLGHDADSAEQTLSAQASAAAANLGRVASVVGAAAAEWQEAFQGEEKALAGGAEILPKFEHHVKEYMEKTEAAAHGVLEWVGTVSHQLEEAVNAVEHFVSGDLTKMITAYRDATITLAVNLIDLLQKKCEEPLRAQEADWRTKIQEVHRFFDEDFEGLAATEERLAAYVVGQWDHLSEAEFISAQAAARTLAQALSSLDQAAGNYEGQLKVAAEMLAEHQGHASTGADKLAGALLTVRGQWATLGIE